MNTAHFQELSPADRAFAEVAQKRLRGSEQLNYVESARLAATRAQVRELVSAPRSNPLWAWIAAPAALAAVMVSMMPFDLTSLQGKVTSSAAQPVPSTEVLATLANPVNAESAAALSWVSDEAGPDFYRDLEFYEWLQSRSPTEPNA